MVAEKLLNFAEAAARHPEFASDLPRFVSRVRSMFTPQDIQAHLVRIERERHESDLTAVEDGGLGFEDPEAVAERARQFDLIKDLLTVTQIGTS